MQRSQQLRNNRWILWIFRDGYDRSRFHIRLTHSHFVTNCILLTLFSIRNLQIVLEAQWQQIIMFFVTFGNDLELNVYLCHEVKTKL